MTAVTAARAALATLGTSLLEFLTEEPLLAAVAVLVLAAVIVALRFLVARIRRTPADAFREALANREAVAVLMHPNPDPDAMSCALATADLANHVGTEATIHYPGQIRHQENRAFETVLETSFDSIDHLTDLPAETVVLVDHNEPRGFDACEQVEPYAVVDHHPGDGTGTHFTDVRTDYGSCAAIFAEYFEALGWQPQDADVDPTLLDGDRPGLSSLTATGLLYGIQSDTDDLTKGASPAEFEAAAYLYQGLDEDRLDRIANPEVDAEVLEIQARAITNRDVRNAFAVSDVGEVSNVDAIAQAADELLRLEGLTAVVVLGQRDGMIHMKGRSRDDRVHMGKILSALVEDVPMAEAGGHARMGAGQISIDHMEGLGPGNGTDKDELVERVFDGLTGDV
jgi:nanoRNase/pAp phosphatase (c-di-AMP/oligoRNAs hydrolase)